MYWFYSARGLLENFCECGIDPLVFIGQLIHQYLVCGLHKVQSYLIIEVNKIIRGGNCMIEQDTRCLRGFREQIRICHKEEASVCLQGYFSIHALSSGNKDKYMWMYLELIFQINSVDWNEHSYQGSTKTRGIGR